MKELKNNNNGFMLLMMLASHISFGYCCYHYKLGSTVVTWQEGLNPKLTGQGLSLRSSGSIRVPPVHPGSSQPSTTLGEVGPRSRSGSGPTDPLSSRNSFAQPRTVTTKLQRVDVNSKLCCYRTEMCFLFPPLHE